MKTLAIIKPLKLICFFLYLSSVDLSAKDNNYKSIQDNFRLVSVEYFDIRGKKHNNYNSLAVGVYIEVKHYKSGRTESRKIYIIH